MEMEVGIVGSETSCAVLSHCFSDCTFARERAFFARGSCQLQNNSIDYEFN